VNLSITFGSFNKSYTTISTAELGATLENAGIVWGEPFVYDMQNEQH